MSVKSTLLAAIAATVFAIPALAIPVLAGDIMVDDAYARSSGKSAKSGAAFMMLMNHGATDDRLVAASTDAAARVELHTHKENSDGVMQMMEIQGGIEIPAHGMHALKRGGDHVMLMGLTGPLEHGDTVTLTLTFEQAGDITIDVPVDQHRKPAKAHSH